jgi:prolyl oligopeptidase
VEPVTEIFHGIPVTDPYRWLEDQHSPETRTWIEEQTKYARTYLDAIPGRERIRQRVRELLDVETHDSLLKCGIRYVFRKRRPGEEQPSIYLREEPDGQDQLLIDPASRGTGNYTAVKPLRVSPDGSLLLYEVKQGGERKGCFEILDIASRRRLPDSLPHGYLRGFAFAPDGKSYYYVHEATAEKRPFYRAAYQHRIGMQFELDREIFCAGEDKKLTLVIIPGRHCLGLLVYRDLDKVYTDFYLWGMGSTGLPLSILRNADYLFAPRFLGARILALTDNGSPNRRIVEVRPRRHHDPLLLTLIPETDAMLRTWLISENHILVTHFRGGATQLSVFDSHGKCLGEIPCQRGESLRAVSGDSEDDEIFLERESFTQPVEIMRHSLSSGISVPWARRHISFDGVAYRHSEVTFASKDGTSIPMFLVGRPSVLTGGMHPTVMTSYGGYGIPITPQFSVLVAFLIECGCLFALPIVRGGSEFGVAWHEAAKRQKRQVAFDDFLSAADWLVKTGRTSPEELAIFGGSNSGLLVGAALTQRPDLFRAVLCMVPLLDMLRYHLFDNAYHWKDEFGTAEDSGDFQALARYSPYHAVQQGVAYPATLIVSGDADQNCNPLHARKMTARLQAANGSSNPILLDYTRYRGHSPVLPLSTRIEALTDRLAFLCKQLSLLP